MGNEPSSTKPYLLRALYEWCVDNGFTPYLQVIVDKNTVVPKEHIKNGEIVLNISPLASNKLKITNEQIEFQARFGGAARDLFVPMVAVAAIYAKETGQGMSFERDQTMPTNDTVAPGNEVVTGLRSVADTRAPPDVKRPDPPPDSPTPGGRPPALRRVK